MTGGRRRRFPRRLGGWGFAAPGMALIAVVMGFPLVYAGLLSVSSFTLLHPRLAPFTWAANYAAIAADPYFWHSLLLTVGYSALTVAAEFVLGLAVALMLNRVIRFRPLYFAILTIPMAMSPVSVGLVWHMLLQPNLGIVNTLLRSMGGAGFNWLGSPTFAFWTIAGVDLWQQVSFVILILTASLASLPKDPYEAAEMDGARPWQQFWHLTLPMLRPVAAIAVIIQLINEARTYDLVYVLTRGGPGVSTDLLSYFAYRRAFLGLSVNEGAAISFVLLALVLVLTIAFFLLVERRK